MRRHRKTVVAAWIAAVLTLTASQTTRAAEPLSIRIYDTLHNSAATLASARAVAGAILAAGGVDTVTWRDCSTGCADPVNPARGRELLVRIVRAPAGVQAGSLGCAVIDLKIGAGTLATIYGDRVSLVAARAGVAEATLLGRAMAHEIGHLLLGTSRHTTAGLMRAQWSDRELRNNAAGDWTLGKLEVRREKEEGLSPSSF
jgi:hypothetical protein